MSKEARDALIHAKAIAGNTDFFDSCLDFYLKTGFLTQKQIDALKNIEEDYEYNELGGLDMGPEWWKD